MKIRIGYELIYECPQPTPMILTLSVHYTRVSDIIIPDHLIADPPVPLAAYRDSFGNWCSRIVAPAGQLRLCRRCGSCGIRASRRWLPGGSQQTPVEALPDETMLFLLGSRYCETDRLSETAWQLFGNAPTGWAARPGDLRPRASAHCIRLRACARHQDRLGGFPREDRRLPRLCAPRRRVLSLHEHPRTLLHRLPRRHRRAAALRPDGFRRLVRGLPRRHWYTFDARNNTPRIGRVLIARGRDAADVAISSTFGPTILKSFKVRTDEVSEG